MCKHLRGLIANNEEQFFSSTLPVETGNGQNWMALLAMSLLMKNGHLLFPFLAGLPYQILSSSPLCCWISQFSATWGTFKDHTSQLWCCSSNASAGHNGACQALGLP